MTEFQSSVYWPSFHKIWHYSSIFDFHLMIEPSCTWCTYSSYVYIVALCRNFIVRDFRGERKRRNQKFVMLQIFSVIKKFIIFSNERFKYFTNMMWRQNSQNLFYHSKELDWKYQNKFLRNSILDLPQTYKRCFLRLKLNCSCFMVNPHFN